MNNETEEVCKDRTMVNLNPQLLSLAVGVVAAVGSEGPKAGHRMFSRAFPPCFAL